MFRRFGWVALTLGAAAAGAHAQDSRVEIGGNVGWTFSDGVTFDGVAVNGNVFNSVEPDDSISYGATLGFFVNENFEVEFLWNRQDSTLVAGGTTSVSVADQSIDNYHGAIVYNLGDPASRVRPYVFGGLGATRYGSLSFTGLNGQPRDIDGESKFSTTWGAGVKIYPGERAGLKLGVRWTPTYIKTDTVGYWCDPYWGCFTVGDAQYSNQFELTGGLTFRF